MPHFLDSIDRAEQSRIVPSDHQDWQALIICRNGNKYMAAILTCGIHLCNYSHRPAETQRRGEVIVACYPFDGDSQTLTYSIKSIAELICILDYNDNRLASLRPTHME